MSTSTAAKQPGMATTLPTKGYPSNKTRAAPCKRVLPLFRTI